MAFLPAIPTLLASAFAAAAPTTITTAAGTVAGTAAAGGLASTVSGIGVGLSLASGAIGAYGALKSGQAEANAAKFNASVAAQNAQISGKNAELAGQAGAEQAGMASLRGRAAARALVANEAAGNIDVNSGSPLAVRQSEQELSELDALTVRSNATKQAYGYTTQATSQKAESELQSYQASQDLAAGGITAGSTFLGGVSSGASKWAQFQLQSGLNA